MRLLLFCPANADEIFVSLLWRAGATLTAFLKVYFLTRLQLQSHYQHLILRQLSFKHSSLSPVLSIFVSTSIFIRFSILIRHPEIVQILLELILCPLGRCPKDTRALFSTHSGHGNRTSSDHRRWWRGRCCSAGTPFLRFPQPIDTSYATSV